MDDDSILVQYILRSIRPVGQFLFVAIFSVFWKRIKFE